MASGRRGRHMDMTYIGDRDSSAEYCPHEEALVCLPKLLGLETCCAAWHRAGSRILEEEEEEEGSVETVGFNKEECNLYVPDDKALHCNSMLRRDWRKKSWMKKKRPDEVIGEENL